MKKVFEPGELEIDIQSDPNRVIEIQGKVKEYLEANKQRQEGIRQELLNKGAWALPGLINSTYVWMNKISGDKVLQEKLSSLIAELAKDNEAAINLVAKSGVLEDPFDVPRSIAENALDKLDWQPEAGIQKQTRREIDRQKKMGNIPVVLDLYRLLLRARNENDLIGAINQCKKWVSSHDRSAGQLLKVLIDSYPDHVEKILTEIILATTYNDQSLAEMLINPLGEIPSAWFSNNILIHVSINVLDECSPPRHTTVEYLWGEAAEHFKHKSAELWSKQIVKTGSEIQKTGTRIQDETTESLYRYWFQALEHAGETDYVISAAFSDDEDWGVAAALQLCFKEKSKHPETKKVFTEALEKLRNENEWRYEAAMERYDQISGKKKKKSEITSPIGASPLTDEGSKKSKRY